jgi:hypothetical protein
MVTTGGWFVNGELEWVDELAPGEVIRERVGDGGFGRKNDKWCGFCKYLAASISLFANERKRKSGYRCFNAYSVSDRSGINGCYRV